MSFPTFTAVTNWADNTPFEQAHLDAFLTGLETYINDNIVANGVSTSGDQEIDGTWVFNNTVTFGAATTFNDEATFTNTASFNGAVTVTGQLTAPRLARSVLDQVGVYNIGFTHGTDNSILKITSANGTAFSASNVGYVVMPTVAGIVNVYSVTSDVNLDLQGAHWGYDTYGDVNDAILNVFAVQQNGTLKWGVSLSGGMLEVGSSEDVTAAANATTFNLVLMDSSISANAECINAGYIVCDFDDTGNGGGENFWEIVEFHPGESSDGLWQDFPKGSGIYTGFSAVPTAPLFRWSRVGKTVTVQHDYLDGTTAVGTSNATSFTVKAFIPASATGASHSTSLAYDNTAYPTIPGGVAIANSGTSISLYLNMSSASSWTNSGSKFAHFRITYEGDF